MALRRPRRIGGKWNTQNERKPAMDKFWASLNPVVTGSWKHQCFCGSVAAKLYRKAYWCMGCGREKMPVFGKCGCELCEVLS